jgi:hypothetical protein
VSCNSDNINYQLSSLGDNAWRSRLGKRLKFSLSESQLEKTLEDLRKLNQDFRTLASQTIKLDGELKTIIKYTPNLLSASHSECDDISTLATDVFSGLNAPSGSSRTSNFDMDAEDLEERSRFHVNETEVNSKPARSAQFEVSEDIRSVLSDTDDIHSLSASRRSHQETVAEEHVAIFLARREELKPLYEEALTRMEKERFVDNYRRLLKRYYLDLSKHAQGNLEKAAISLLRSRWARTRIAERISDIIKPESERSIVEMEEHIRQTELKVLDLEAWIASNQGLAPINDPTAENCEDDEDLSSEEDDFPEDSKGSELPNISDIERLLMSGPSFVSLLVNLRIFLLPSSLGPLTRILMTMPRDRVSFLHHHNVSLADKIKIVIEGRTSDNWNWWPLEQPMKALQKGQTRIKWQCVSLFHSLSNDLIFD